MDIKTYACILLSIILSLGGCSDSNANLDAKAPPVGLSKASPVGSFEEELKKIHTMAAYGMDGDVWMFFIELEKRLGTLPAEKRVEAFLSVERLLNMSYLKDTDSMGNRRMSISRYLTTVKIVSEMFSRLLDDPESVWLFQLRKLEVYNEEIERSHLPSFGNNEPTMGLRDTKESYRFGLGGGGVSMRSGMGLKIRRSSIISMRCLLNENGSGSNAWKRSPSVRSSFVTQRI